MFDLWLENIKSLEKYSNKLIEDCGFSIRVKLMIKVLNQISKENRLSEYDEKIFEYFHHLMWYYYQTISLYEQNKEDITNSKAKEIIDGICSVLSAQLNQFQDNQKYEYIYSDKSIHKNPIKIEKDEIIGKTKQYVLSAIEDIQKEYLETSGSICSEYLMENFFKAQDQHVLYIEVLEDIYLSIINQTVDKLYKTYADITKGSIEKINNLQFRKAANFYYESIKQEKDNLGIIIKVQVNALEDELKHMPIEVIEAQKIHEILDTLIEAYQHLGKEIELLALYFKESENKEVVLFTREEFIEYFLNEGAKKFIEDLTLKEFPSHIAEIITETKTWNQKFELEFSKYVDEFIYKNYIGNTISDTKVVVDGFIIDKEAMVESFLECFKSINNYYTENMEALIQTPFCDIFKGIYETIDIKIESLSENKVAFFEEFHTHFHKKNTFISIKDEDKALLEKDLLCFYYDSVPKNDVAFNAILEQLNEKIPSHEVILKYVAHLEKSKQQQSEMILKKYIGFLRQHLLFELTTYEEILNYSISRLREDQELDVVKGFIETIDTVSIRIQELLKKYDIQTIEPQPCDLFDGKEHEVLMAEKQEGFEKGQIIKLMNTGYKYNNTVIIRANVIAAK